MQTSDSIELVLLQSGLDGGPAHLVGLVDEATVVVIALDLVVGVGHHAEGEEARPGESRVRNLKNMNF